MRRAAACLALLPILALLAGPRPAAAAAEFLDGVFTQGGFAIGRTAPGAAVRFDGRTVQVGPDGRFVIGFHR
ncbi:hypothetical protein SB717_37435, partial [Priestia sp. SIMBA_032]|uniref:hypothetical protein n=1 Tax=Priestia sp. SIMBA_032 TaxID=3085775 RepID=UPI00397B67E7